MSTEYTTIVDRVVAILDAERTDKLSEDLSSPLTAVRKGQYSQGDSAAKPVLYVRLRRMSLVSELAGGLAREERMMLLISGATQATTQQAAWDDAMSLANNVEHVLANYPTDDANWGASYFGWGYSADDETPQVFGEFEAEPGADICVVHFQLLWSCDIRIARDAL